LRKLGKWDEELCLLDGRFSKREGIIGKVNRIEIWEFE
jgi:hypothetical protein